MQVLTKTKTKNNFLVVIYSVALFTQSPQVTAQNMPDAGALMRQTEQTLRLNPAYQRDTPLRDALPPPMVLTDSLVVTVSQFKILGTKLVSSQDLQQAVQPFANKPLGKIDLQHLTDAVSNVYRQVGWLVQVYIPKQKMGGDTLLIQVIETVPPATPRQ
jgi:hemolysin activation/secretion protein